MQNVKRVPNWKNWAMREYWESLEFARFASGLPGSQVEIPKGREDYYNEIVAIAERSIVTGTVRLHASPQEWIEFAVKKKIKLPKGLRDAVAKFSSSPAQSKKDSGAVPVKRRPGDEKKEQHTMLRLIGHMAIAGHGVDLSKPYAAAREIHGHIKNTGYEISEPTVAKYLKLAALELQIKITETQEKQELPTQLR